jgi:hypothetical protein
MIPVSSLKILSMNILKNIVALTLIITSCGVSNPGDRKSRKEKSMTSDSTRLYGYNKSFLAKHVSFVELKKGKSALIVVPAWQGRVMTSTAEGESGFSFGWINNKAIESGIISAHINAYGGEERLWLGPEGGQFSIFFSKGKEFTFENWQTPAFIDTNPFDVTSQTDSSVTFERDEKLVNYSGTVFSIGIKREVRLLSDNEIIKQTGIDVSGINCVAYTSTNILLNKGKNTWTKESGLLSIWMLGMFIPSDSVVIVIPVREGDVEKLGVAVNDNYFGRISESRLKFTGNRVFLKADGKSRGKIGIPPLRAEGVMGSFDSENNILTLLFCELPENTVDYVNSSWQIQKNPYSGDALNAYNDGPLEDGSQMGPFYELETSSPAAALVPGKSIMHIQTTLHISGKRNRLNEISLKTLGVSLDEIINKFKQ